MTTKYSSPSTASLMSLFRSLSGWARSPGRTMYSNTRSVKHISLPFVVTRVGRHETIVAYRGTPPTERPSLGAISQLLPDDDRLMNSQGYA